MATIAAAVAWATRIEAPCSGDTIAAGVSAVWPGIVSLRKPKLVSDAVAPPGRSGWMTLMPGTSIRASRQHRWHAVA